MHIKKGGRGCDYWVVNCPCHRDADKQGQVKKHRLLMEIHLGRYLKPKEVVHHIDGNGLNNDLSNLELLTHSEHARLHNIKRSPYKGSRKCIVGGCNRNIVVKFMCFKHYQRAVRIFNGEILWKITAP